MFVPRRYDILAGKKAAPVIINDRIHVFLYIRSMIYK